MKNHDLENRCFLNFKIIFDRFSLGKKNVAKVIKLKTVLFSYYYLIKFFFLNEKLLKQPLFLYYCFTVDLIFFFFEN